MRFERQKHKVEIDGTEYEMRYPSQIEIAQQIDKEREMFASGASQVEIAKSANAYYAALGLPIEVAETLTRKEANELSRALFEGN